MELAARVRAVERDKRAMIARQSVRLDAKITTRALFAVAFSVAWASCMRISPRQHISSLVSRPTPDSGGTIVISVGSLQTTLTLDPTTGKAVTP